MKNLPVTYSRFLAGASQVDITPDPGIPLTGYIAREGVSTGIHDRLAGAVLVLSSEEQRAALVSCDLVGLDRPAVNSIRQKIQSATGIPAQNIMLACMHTHSGPATIFLQDCGEVDPTYLNTLEGKLETATREAVARLQPVQMKWGKGVLPGWAHDRRFPGADIDEDLGVIGLFDNQGQPVVVLVNYACHPVVLGADNRLISADYPGYLKRTLQDRLGCPAIFITGASGNVDPVRRGSFEAAQDFGQALAENALHLLDEAPFAGPGRLITHTVTFELPLLPLPTKEELSHEIASHRQRAASAVRAGKSIEGKMEAAMLHWAETTLAKIESGQVETSLAGEVQALRIGKAAMIGVSGELFSSLGQAIKNGAGEDRTVFISAYTNGDVGYIPPRAEYDRGGYEIVEAYRYYGYPAALAPEAGEMIVETGVSFLAERV